MLTFSRFGHHGNLGNQLFQYASLLGFAAKYETELLLPTWRYSQYFEEAPKVIQPGSGIKFNCIAERDFHYRPDLWDEHEDKFRKENVDVLGWLQSEKYFESVKEQVREKLTFTDHFKKECHARSGHAFDKPAICISIRRGDYVGNPNYVLLPIGYYITALTANFPDWRTKYNLYVFSDDLEYARHHFSCLDNAFFPDGFTDVEQLCAMSQCTHFIIANSTFSWWGAWLGEKKGTKIIRPCYHFGPMLSATHTDKDFYPERWSAWDHKQKNGYDKTIPLTDVTFTIPVFYDHPDRRENIDLSIASIVKYFKTNFIVAEQYSEKPHFDYIKKYFKYIEFHEQGLFHRTKMLNAMALEAATPIIVNWDADNIIAPMQLWEAAHKIRTGADMVFPFDGRCARVSRDWYAKILKSLDTAIFYKQNFTGLAPGDERSVGQAVFFKKESFIAGGMENQYMVSYAPEDRERAARFAILGYKICNIPGPVYHMDHHIGQNSAPSHPRFLPNLNEYNKVGAMKREELEAYIQTWPWVSGENQVQTEAKSEKIQTGLSGKKKLKEKKEGQAPTKFAIIIPYRDRGDDLAKLLAAFAARKMPYRYEVFVIEQNGNGLFNRAKLLNVGFLETRKDFDFWVFHDVDMIPVNADYSYPEKPTHIATQCSQFDYKMPYPDYFGGVTLFNRNYYEAVNGHSNMYEGWGKEDDDIFVRLFRMGFEVERRECRFESVPHESANLSRAVMESNAKLLQQARYGNEDLYKKSGISDCLYTVKSRKVYKECTIITVEI